MANKEVEFHEAASEEFEAVSIGIWNAAQAPLRGLQAS
jgi:hypothetical protein